MPRILLALSIGALFGAGLATSDMTNPAKVQNFLDVAGSWDPSLAFVMGGALVVSALGYQVARRRAAPWLGPRFELPTRTDLDLPLLLGSALFGVGWGLGGFCPGPALVSMGALAPEAVFFGLGMVGGMLLHRAFERLHSLAPPPAARGKHGEHGEQAVKGTS